jgi:flagellar protein FliT
MTTTDVLSMYENIAGLTSQMALAARANDWDCLSELEHQCAVEARSMGTGPLPALSGAARLHKLDLLRKILANDREIRSVTEPWMVQLSTVMAAPQSGR